MTPEEVWLYFTRPYVALAGLLIILGLPFVYRKVGLGLNKRMFVCLMCGNCCRFDVIEASKEDVERIESKGYTGFYEKKGGVIKLRKANGRCVFHEGGLCSIHAFKPEVCERFPFFECYGVPYVRGLLTCPGLRKLENELSGNDR